MEISDLISPQSIIDAVVMNEDLCFHTSFFEKEGNIDAFPLPLLTTVLMDDRTYVVILCPVCRKRYLEASKRLQYVLEEKTSRK